MKKLFKLFLTLSLLSYSFNIEARNDTVFIDIDKALSSPKAKEVLDPSIKLEFAQGKGKILLKDAVTNKKTNNFGRSDEEGCTWAFLSAVKQLQEKAREYNANKVINIISYYKRQPYTSASKVECHAGGAVAGVALKGDIAK